MVGGDDFTVRGGAGDAAIGSSRCSPSRWPTSCALPIVRLIDGTGGGGSVKTLETEQRTYVPYMQGWKYVTDNMATVPVVGLWPRSGRGPRLGAVVTSHYSVMVKENSQMFIAGPPLVARAGQDVTKEELGGRRRCTPRLAPVDDVVDSEEEAFARTRAFPVLSAVVGRTSLPPRAARAPIRWDRARGLADRQAIRATAARSTNAPRRSSRPSSTRTPFVRDRPQVRRLGRHWPCASRRLAGRDCCTSDPYFYGGGWTAGTPRSRSRALRRSRADLPSAGCRPRRHSGICDRAGVREGRHHPPRLRARVAAVYQATVPWCAVMLRRAFGVAGAAHSNYTRVATTAMLAVRQLGLAADRGRLESRLSRRACGVRQS